MVKRDTLSSPSFSSNTLLWTACSRPSHSLERPSTSEYKALVAC